MITTIIIWGVCVCAIIIANILIKKHFEKKIAKLDRKIEQIELELAKTLKERPWGEWPPCRRRRAGRRRRNWSRQRRPCCPGRRSPGPPTRGGTPCG